jgi:hypothetical protein
MHFIRVATTLFHMTIRSYNKINLKFGELCQRKTLCFFVQNYRKKIFYNQTT